MDSPNSRRRFVRILVGSFAGVAGLPGLALAREAGAGRAPGPHPDPRPGITAAGVLKADRIENPDVRAIYDKVREIPQVVDGIRCHCGCADLEGYYSLLTCYEANGMAQACQICQGQASLVHRLHTQGWSLNGIRTAIDARFAT